MRIDAQTGHLPFHLRRWRLRRWVMLLGRGRALTGFERAEGLCPAVYRRRDENHHRQRRQQSQARALRAVRTAERGGTGNCSAEVIAPARCASPTSPAEAALHRACGRSAPGRASRAEPAATPLTPPALTAPASARTMISLCGPWRGGGGGGHAPEN